MSERREWWLRFDSGGTFYGISTKGPNTIQRSNEEVHVREVLPGDEPLACQLGDANLELESLKQQHAKLVEVARRVVAYRQTRGIGGIAAVVEELEQVLEGD